MSEQESKSSGLTRRDAFRALGISAGVVTLASKLAAGASGNGRLSLPFRPGTKGCAAFAGPGAA